MASLLYNTPPPPAMPRPAGGVGVNTSTLAGQAVSRIGSSFWPLDVSFMRSAPAPPNPRRPTANVSGLHSQIVDSGSGPPQARCRVIDLPGEPSRALQASLA